MEEKDTHGMFNDLYTPHFISFCRLLNVIFSLSSVSPDVISSLTPLEFLECAFHCEVRIEIKCTYEWMNERMKGGKSRRSGKLQSTRGSLSCLSKNEEKIACLFLSCVSVHIKKDFSISSLSSCSASCPASSSELHSSLMSWRIPSDTSCNTLSMYVMSLESCVSLFLDSLSCLSFSPSSLKTSYISCLQFVYQLSLSLCILFGKIFPDCFRWWSLWCTCSVWSLMCSVCLWCEGGGRLEAGFKRRTREEQEEKLKSENLRREKRERHAILASLFTHDSFLWVFSLLLLIHLLLMLMLSSSHQKQSLLSSCVQVLLSSYCSFLCHSFWCIFFPLTTSIPWRIRLND